MGARDELDQIRQRADAATDGPWEADGTEVSQHWSRPQPWETVASSEVACMAYCYGGSARGIEREADAEFIAASRTDVPCLVAALTAVLDAQEVIVQGIGHEVYAAGSIDPEECTEECPACALDEMYAAITEHLRSDRA